MRNIDENMVRAMEETPESFIQVSMLWINMKVNGHHVKGCHLQTINLFRINKNHDFS